MTYYLKFLPEIEKDLISGFSWHESKTQGLGEDFLRMFYASVNGIPRNPSSSIRPQLPRKTSWKIRIDIPNFQCNTLA